MLEQALDCLFGNGEEVFMFASDYPHPEGSKDPVGRFASALAASNISETAQERFYSGTVAQLMPL